MKNIQKLIQVLLTIMVVFSLMPAGIYGAGTSTGGSGTTDGDSNTNTQNQQQTSVNCEDRTLRADRIRCRLENKDRLADSEQARIPESCRNLASTSSTSTGISRDECIEFYRKIGETGRNCYRKDMTSRQKVVCFR